ncbi:hypothetical protein AVEN_220293-1 [Araneus ventricosus]|uniref:Uncharacterized protein n=1 Tax=Araneus ventricosus TaxID=182803 RepID=A0A4Y2WT48_ARAVE|nr:hypothetical protein AVEN_163590-1 [Araneus ventricosus]GBO40379.1 hypothetical protein AVEN_220293-1 [Araneus ventricosus]
MEQRINLKFLSKLGKSAGECNAAAGICTDSVLQGAQTTLGSYSSFTATSEATWLLISLSRSCTGLYRYACKAVSGSTGRHPPYSPHLSPQDFFLFPKLKEALKKRRFTGIRHIQTALTWVLKAVLVEEFSRAFDDMYTRC